MKKRQIILYVVVMIILLTTSVYATISAELNLDVKSNGSVYPGDSFEVTIKLSKLETDNGIKAVEGYIDIDENIVEDLTVDSIVTDENGKVKINEDNILPVYDSSNLSETGIIFTENPASKDGDYKIVINFSKPITSQDTNLITLKLKVKDNCEVGKHTDTVVYKLFKIFTDNAEEKQALNDKTITLTVSERKEPVENKPENNTTGGTNNVTNNGTNNGTGSGSKNNTAGGTSNPTNNGTSNNGSNNNRPTNNGTGTPVKNGTSNPGSKDNTVSETNLPKTGARMIIVPIIVLSILGYVCYRKYSKYNNYDK